jgi:hypothetical protein
MITIRSIIDILFHETLSTLKVLAFPPLLTRLLSLCQQASQLGILITFVYDFHFNYLCK